MNARKIERAIPIRNKYCFLIYLLDPALYFRMDSSHCRRIVISLTSAHHHVQVIFMKLTENGNGISTFFGRFRIQWEEIKKRLFYLCLTFLNFYISYYKSHLIGMRHIKSTVG